MGSPIDENPCLICGIKPIESGVHSLELFFRYRYEVDSKVCVYPGGGYTLSVWNQEGSVEIPLNFCPECGRDLRRKDGKRGSGLTRATAGRIVPSAGMIADMTLLRFARNVAQRWRP